MGWAIMSCKKHVQFKHPQTLQEAIGLATKFEALEGPIDRVKKPPEETTMVVPIASHNTEEIKTSQNITLDQISKLIDTKLDKVLPGKEIRDTIIDVGIFLFPDKGEIQGLITLEKK